MDIRNCSRCGRIYVYDGFNICIKCRQEDEEDFQKVKKYLAEHPGANIMEVAEGTGVDSKKIINFLKEGRLEIADDSNIILTCERCGKSIRTGRFCNQCVLDLEKELKGAVRDSGLKQQNYKAKERIRIIDRRNRDK
ncbi:MAG: MerR family transcriptional regulator [Tissierellia bacterium]|nr:MerR family transcriptional regulator [Tissierellia bacterium]